MANQEHIDILKQGVEVWNQWREKCFYIHVDLSHANLHAIYLNEANFYRADLSHADLSEANLSRVNLYHADLSEANLSGAKLSVSDLSRVSLYKANLSRANLYRTNLNEADLHEADLSEADLYKVVFNGAILTKTNFTKARMLWTILGDVDLRTAEGLETIFHSGPSTIGIDTIYLSHGNIPEVFLRGAGVQKNLLDYMHSLVNEPFDFYTCFISYANQDEDFTKRLYADLQSSGVRCWFAPEDLKIGEKFWHRIDESIRLYDKLLVVLSEHSVESEWVEREVIAALEKERQQQQLVLFPISLDGVFKHTFAPWAADLRRQRHIGDFTCWKNHDDYQKAFNRLLRDLKAEP